MKLQFLKVRGAIGFKKNLGLDEIEVDFTSFQPGLVVLIGDNGFGKTTLIENLHPYLQLASKPGKLQDHFFLKDSYRMLKVEMNNNIYECKILIDGMTGAAEAYIFENGTPLNDGKLTTYKEEVNRIFGTPKLFFNSVFSAVKSEGLAKMEISERRKLFYEILNLNKYEVYKEIAKKEFTKTENKFAIASSEINVLKTENDSIVYTKPMIAEKVYESQEKEKMIELSKTKLQEYRQKKEKLTNDIAGLRIKMEDDKEARAKIEQLDKELAELKTQYDVDKFNLEHETNKAKSNFETDNPETEKIKKLEAEKQVAAEKAQIEEKRIKDEAEQIKKDKLSVQTKIDACKLSIDRLNKLIANKETIDKTIKEKKEITARLNELMVEDKQITDQIRAIEDERQGYEKELREYEAETRLKEKELDLAEDQAQGIEKEIERLTKDNDNRIKELQTEIDIIDNSGCDSPTLGQSCQFLVKAHQTKTNLPELKKKFEAELKALQTDHEKACAKHKAIGDEVTERHKYSAQRNAEIQTSYNNKIGDLPVKLQAIGDEIKQKSSRLAEINKHNWEELEKEANQAQQQVEIETNTIESNTNLLSEKSKMLNKLSLDLGNTQNTLADKLNDIDAQIVSIKLLIQRERGRIEKEFQEKQERLLTAYNDNRVRKIAEKENFSKKVDPELSVKHNRTIAEITETETMIRDAEEATEAMRTELTDLKVKVKEMEDALIKKVQNEDRLKSKDAELQFLQREIKDYAFLIKAFDKTGIPVLKLENSGYEITSIVNELLSLFENPFRIAIETTKPTADKKSMKEVFNINVIDEDGICELGNKSTGEMIWIETGIQQATGKAVRKQGRDIKTNFIDEKDGNLSLKNAYHYINMIKKAHELSGYHLTIMISHRPEIQDIIPQQIHFSKENGIEIIMEQG